MIYLLLSILSSTLIFLTFKITDRFKTDLVKLITVNYLVAALLGFSFNHYPDSPEKILFSPWIPYAILIGILFICAFFLIGYSTRHSGIAVTTIAGKMSVVIPILFSIFFFSEKASFLKTIGLVLAIAAVFLSCYRPLNKIANIWLTALPIAIFIGTGIADSTVKYAQTRFVSNDMSLLFSAFVFLIALICGILYMLLSKKSSSKLISIAELTGGSILGIVNFGSLYFFIRALNSSWLESSVIFGLNSLFIVLLSVLIGAGLFHEKLSKVNFAGIIMAVLAILILMNY